MRAFITGTGTDVGKTWLTAQLAARLRQRGRRVGAAKPIETGCTPTPRDARALAIAAGSPELEGAPGFYRGRLPLAPWAATLEGDVLTPTLPDLVRSIHAVLHPYEDWLVEGAGGLLVPFDRDHDLADLAVALAMPLLLVTHATLGTISHTLTAMESARSRGLAIAAIVINHPQPEPAPPRTCEIIAARVTGIPVVELLHQQVAPDAVLDDLLEHLDRASSTYQY